MKLIGFLGLATLAAACGTNSAGPDGETTPGGHGASDQEIAGCKDACDQLKFFMCNDSLDQAGCYADCSAASSDQIELFTACVKTDTCDASCSTHIQAPDSTTSGGPTGGGPTGGGPTGGTTTGEMTTGGSSVDAACHAACEQLQFFSCIDATTFGTCGSLCMSAETSKKQTFASCVESGSVDQCQAVDCYYQFDPSAVPGPTPQQLADCKKSCQDLGFFDCLTGPEAAQCAAACDTLTKEQIEAFLICTSDPTDCSAVAGCL